MTVIGVLAALVVLTAAAVLMVGVAVVTRPASVAAGHRRVLHRFAGHPVEARFEGDLTAGCTIGPRACGAVWDIEEAQ